MGGMSKKKLVAREILSVIMILSMIMFCRPFDANNVMCAIGNYVQM